MKRNTVLQFAVVALLVMLGLMLFAPKSKSAESQTNLNAGRFQLLEGTYTINSKGTAFKETDIFRIDSQTGTTWIYREGQTNSGTLYSRWDKISE